MQVTVSYTVLTREEEIAVDFLDGNPEILAAPVDRPLGQRPEARKRRKDGFFAATTFARS